MEEIYPVAAELPASERAAYLETVCEGRPEMRARIERMLEVGGIAALLQHGANVTVPPEIAEELDGLKPEEVGERMGNYKLLQQIGEGGFGVVWMAEQIEPVQRRVALKILKPGMDTKEVIARFEQERQALAMMDLSQTGLARHAGVSRFVVQDIGAPSVRGSASQRVTNISERVHEGILADLANAVPRWKELIARSYLSPAGRDHYVSILDDRLRRLHLGVS